jgi:dTMP kinase
MKGLFIVLEGIDGAGTTTQAHRLAAAIRANGRSVRVTREPSDGPIGAMLRQVMSGRLVNPDGRAPSWETMALLFAADRMDHVASEIEPFIAEGGVIISDRYDASSLGYQSVSSGAAAGSLDWIRTLNRYARRPDLTLVLDVAFDLAAARREVRGEAAQMYEQNEVQRALAEFYRTLPSHMPGDRIEIVDGSLTQESVTSALLAHVKPYLSE